MSEQEKPLSVKERMALIKKAEGPSGVTVGYDPVTKRILDELDQLQKEMKQLHERIGSLSVSDSQEVLQMVGDTIVAAQSKLSPEELEKARHAANLDMQRLVGYYTQQLKKRTDEALGEKKQWFEPPVTDTIHIAQFEFKFEAGVGAHYPVAAIDAYQNRQEGLRQWRALKKELRAAGPTEADRADYMEAGQYGRVLQKYRGG